jgi:hypothetical protein
MACNGEITGVNFRNLGVGIRISNITPTACSITNSSNTAMLTWPAHGKPFTGLHTRIGQLHDHHRDRLAEVMQACAAAPCSARDIIPVMFKRELDLHQMTFAMGEAIAHLHALYFEGKLSRSLDADGIIRFKQI